MEQDETSDDEWEQVGEDGEDGGVDYVILSKSLS